MSAIADDNGVLLERAGPGPRGRNVDRHRRVAPNRAVALATDIDGDAAFAERVLAVAGAFARD